MSHVVHESKASATNESAYQAAFDATAKERAALSPTDLLPINLDVVQVVNTVLGTVARLAMLRDGIQEAIPQLDIARFDRLATYARALSYAQGSFMAAASPNDSLPQLAERGSEVRDVFTKTVIALAAKGVVSKSRLDDLAGATATSSSPTASPR